MELLLFDLIDTISKMNPSASLDQHDFEKISSPVGYGFPLAFQVRLQSETIEMPKVIFQILRQPIKLAPVKFL